MRLLLVALQAALAESRTLAQTSRLSEAGIFGFYFLESFLGGFAGDIAALRLNFMADLGHFRGDFLSEGRTIELQEALDFVVGEMRVVNGDQLIAELIDVEFLLISRGERADEVLAFFIVGHSGEEAFAKLVGGIVDGVLDLIASADKLHKRTNVRFLGGIDFWRGILRGSLRGLHGVLRSSLNGNEKCSDVDKDEGENGFHDVTSFFPNFCGANREKGRAEHRK